MKAKQSGFTIIEVVIVLVILGILASIAFPAYQEHTMKARRAMGQQALLDTAQRLERCATQNLSYEAANCPVVLPFNAPVDAATMYYTISIANRTARTYTLTATAINVQAGDTDCVTMNIDNLGVKTAPDADCW